MAEKRRSLGKGIGALFPAEQEEQKARPIDVFFKNPKDSAAQSSEKSATRSDVSNSSPRKSRGSEDDVAPSTVSAANGVAVEDRTPTLGKTARKKSAGEKISDRDKTGSQSEEELAKLPTERRGASKQTSSTAGAVQTDSPSHVSDTTTSDDDASDSDADLIPVPGATFGEISISEIVPNQKQPRQIFDEDDLSELADSIREVGVLQPIVVRPLMEPLPDVPEARYELIMGERRWRASKLAGNDFVPAVVRRTENADLLRDALLENLHRSQLNALEEAAAYQQLLEDFNCTQEELSRRIARSRPQISNTLRLLKLPPLVQRRVAAGVLSAGHARALLGLTDPAAMERLAQRIVAEGLSVRAVEEIVAIGEDGPDTPRSRRRVAQYEDELNTVALRLADRFDTRVKVNMGLRKGKIAIDFASIEDLNRILDVLNERPVDTPDNRG